MRRWSLAAVLALATVGSAAAVSSRRPVVADGKSPAVAAGLRPTLLAPGVVSTGDSESHPVLSPDGHTLYFVKLSPDFAHWTVVTSERTGQDWGSPGVAWFSGRWDDADVSFSPDGSTIYFISNRPDDEEGPARSDTDMFRIRHGPSGWLPAERIRTLASAGNEWYPNQASSGTLYFGSERREGNRGPEGTSDLWRSPRLGDSFGPPENLGAVVNTEGQDIEPWVAPDESYLVFASKGRPDTLGSYDLYVSYQCEGAWTTPHALGGGVNSPGWEFAARFSPDGKTFFFASNRSASPRGSKIGLRGREGYTHLVDRLRSPGNGLFDIYRIDASALGLASPCPNGRSG